MDSCLFCASYCRPPELFPVGVVNAPPGIFITPEVGLGISTEEEESPPCPPPLLEPREEDSAIQNSLKVILILGRILKIPKDKLCQFLGENGGQSHPDSWFQTCTTCGEVVHQFLETLKEMAKLERKLVKMEGVLRGKIVETKDILATNSVWARIRSHVLRDFLAQVCLQEKSGKLKIAEKKAKRAPKAEQMSEEWNIGGTVIKKEIKTHQSSSSASLFLDSNSESESADENGGAEELEVDIKLRTAPKPPPASGAQDFGSLWSEFGLDSSTPRYKCYQNECDFTSNKILEFEAHLKKHLRFNYTSTSSCRPKNQGYSSSLKIPPEKKLTDRQRGLPPPPRRKQEVKPDLAELTAKKPPTFFISEAETEDEPSLSSSKMNSSMILTVSVPEPVVLPRTNGILAAESVKRCAECPFKSRNERQFKNHLKCHLEGSKAAPCENCGIFIIPWAHKLASHRRTCVPPGKKRQKREILSSSTTIPSEVVVEKEGGKPEASASSSGNNPSYTVEIKGSKRYFNCRHCPYKCMAEAGIQGHLRLHGEGSGAISCPDCGYFVLPERLQSHRGAWHATYKTGRNKKKTGTSPGPKRGGFRRGGGRPRKDVSEQQPAQPGTLLFFTCDVCQYSTRHKGQLDTHMEVHKGSGTSRCADCGWNILPGKHNHHLKFCPDPDGQKERRFEASGEDEESPVEMRTLNENSSAS